MLAITHQYEFDLILDILDVYRTTGIQATGNCLADLCGQALNDFVHTAGSRSAAAFDLEKGLGHRDLDFFRIKPRGFAVTTNDVELVVRVAAGLVSGCIRGGVCLGNSFDSALNDVRLHILSSRKRCRLVLL